MNQRKLYELVEKFKGERMSVVGALLGGHRLYHVLILRSRSSGVSETTEESDAYEMLLLEIFTQCGRV
jgi:hypothetical protein